MFFKLHTAHLYDVSRLVFSPIDARLAAQQQYRVCLGGVGGCLGPTTMRSPPTHVEIELGCDNILFPKPLMHF
jgi:hypothetical protein